MTRVEKAKSFPSNPVPVHPVCQVRCNSSSMQTCRFVTLLACLATSVATAEAVSEDAMYAAHTPVLTKKYLRTDAAVATSERTSEEREPLSGLTAILKGSLFKINPKLQAWWWLLLKKKPNTVFGLLKLNTMNSDQLFRSLEFLMLVNFIKKRYPKPKDASIGMMLETFSRQYNGEDVLVKVLLAGTQNDKTKDIAYNMLNAQIKEWVVKRMSADGIFTLLKLHQTDVDKLFASPVYSVWSDFVMRSCLLHEDEANDFMFTTLLSSRFNNDNAAFAEALLAAQKIDGTKSIAKALLEAQIRWWSDKSNTADDVFTQLKLDDTADKKPIESPFFLLWENFIGSCYSYNEGYDLMLAKLSLYYKDKAALESFCTTDSSKLIAEELLKAQDQWWIHEKKAVRPDRCR